MLSNLFKILAIFLMGFAGGAIAPWALGWIKSINPPTPSDAVAIANTYIVFTTIIFVGVTVILAIVGYVFTHHFSATKEEQLSKLIYELKKKIQSNEKVGDETIGIALVNAILEHTDVKRHLESTLNKKVKELIENHRAEINKNAQRANEDASAVNHLASQIDREQP